MGRLSSWICVLCVAALPLGAGEAGATPWKAGVARAAITPEKPLWLAGYGHRDRPAEGKVHDLWIKALALEDGEGHQAVLLTSDVLGFSKIIYERLCEALKKEYGLDRAQVMLTSSHTHSGPVLENSLLPCYPLGAKELALIGEYTSWLEAKIVRTVGEAISRLGPAALSAGEGLATFAVNRRNNKEAEVPRLLSEGAALKGPADWAVPVLSVRGSDGKLLAVVFGYACHNTNLDTYVWCGDYAGFAQLRLEKDHPEAAAMFWAGCGADQNPLPRRSLPLCEKYGQMLAYAVEKVLQKPMRAVPSKLRTSFDFVKLDYERHPTRKELEETAGSKNVVYQRWAKSLIAELDAGKTFARDYPFPVQVWCLGKDQLWITLGGEVVVDYSLRFKVEYGPTTWVAAYSNDVMAYIPSRRVWDEGGYESGALHEYGQPAERWASDVEDRVVKTVQKLVAEVKAAGGSKAPGGAE